MPIKKNKLSYTLNLSEQIKSVKPSKRKEVTELIGITIIDSIEEHLSRGVSPVSKGAYKKSLSKEYAKKTGKKVANLDESGALLGDLRIDNFKDKVTIKITDRKEKLVGYNHNVGDTLPVRKFLPNDETGEVFKKSITRKIKDIIADASED
jgi:methyltransferase-like protein